jgi:hypothetical protein
LYRRETHSVTNEAHCVQRGKWRRVAMAVFEIHIKISC